MKKFRIALMICCMILIIAEIFLLLFADLSRPQLIGSVATAIGMLLTMGSLMVGSKNEKKQKTTDSTL
jgi:hypothetical protein